MYKLHKIAVSYPSNKKVTLFHIRAEQLKSQNLGKCKSMAVVTF